MEGAFDMAKVSAKIESMGDSALSTVDSAPVVPSVAGECIVSHLQFLPYEIIEIIACEDVLSIKDVLNLGATCRQLRSAITNSQNIWKTKFALTWPNSVTYPTKIEEFCNDWLASCKFRHSIDSRTLHFLRKLSEMIYCRSVSLSTPDFDVITKISYEKGTVSFNSVIDCLQDIYNNSEEIFVANPYPLSGRYTLTNRYYARSAIEHLRHMKQELQWHKLCENPVTAIPEKIATFFAQWIDAPIEYDYIDIEKQIHDLTEQIKGTLEKSNPVHKVSSAERQSWAEGHLPGNNWSSSICHQLLSEISHNLFSVFKFHIRIMPTDETFFIDRVIDNKYGHVTILTILYEAIARRLGVRCNIVCFSTHLFITWQDNYELNSPVFYVDIETGTLRGSRGRCPFSNAEVTRESYRKYSHTALLAFLTNQYQCADREAHHMRENEVTCAELLSVIHPNDPEYLLKLAEAYENHNKYVDAAYEKLRILFQSEFLGVRHPVLSYLEAKLSAYDTNIKKTIIPKHHPAEVTYAVGMVCFHMEYQYTCVIRGWDENCKATSDWQERMHVYQLSRGATQPFYQCIAEDGTERYVAQENLTAVVPNRRRLTCIEDIIGFNFSHFDGFCYIPNEQLNFEYPDDGNWRQFYQSKLGFAASFEYRRPSTSVTQ